MSKKAQTEAGKEYKKKIQREMANRIKERRKSLKYTQEQFAEIIDITTSSYRRIENAFQRPSLDTLIKIAQNLKISLDYIVLGKNENFADSPTVAEMLTALLDFSDPDKVKHAAEILIKLTKIKEEQ